MSMTRGRPGSPGVRKSGSVGPEYPESNYENPFNMGIDAGYYNRTEKTVDSPNGTTFGLGDAPLHEDRYDKYWEGGK